MPRPPSTPTAPRSWRGSGGADRAGLLHVCDRNTPIARIVPYEAHDDGFVVHEPEIPADAKRPVRVVKPRKAVDVVRLLREGRDQR